MRTFLLIATTLAALACSDSESPNEPIATPGASGRWVGSSAPGAGVAVTVNVVIAETAGVLTGSGLLDVSSCFGSPYAITVTGARADTTVSFTLLARDVNFTGTLAADSLTGTLTGATCGGSALGPRAIVLRR